MGELMKNSFIIYLMILLVPVGAEAKMYKCVDENGKIVYSNMQCPPDTKMEEIEITRHSESSYQHSSKSTNESGESFSDVVDEISDRPYFEKIRLISNGERVNLNRHIEPGIYTAFMFYADWCRLCRKLGPQVEAKSQSLDSFALRKINVTKWDSPVVAQYGIRSVPYFIVYDIRGKLVEKGSRISNQVFNRIENIN